MRDMASNIAELAFDYLDAPPTVVGSRNWITPSKELDPWFFPQADTLVAAVTDRLLPLPAHVSPHNSTHIEKMNRLKNGI